MPEKRRGRDVVIRFGKKPKKPKKLGPRPVESIGGTWMPAHDIVIAFGVTPGDTQTKIPDAIGAVWAAQGLGVAPTPGSADRIIVDVRTCLQNSTGEAAAEACYGGGFFQGSGGEDASFVQDFDGSGTNAVRFKWPAIACDAGDTTHNAYIQTTFPDPKPDVRMYFQWKHRFGRHPNDTTGLGDNNAYEPQNPDCDGGHKLFYLIQREGGGWGTTNTFYLVFPGGGGAIKITTQAPSSGRSGTFSYDQPTHSGNTYTFTVYAQNESVASAGDGVFRVWIDGDLVLEDTSAPTGILPYRVWQAPTTFRYTDFDMTGYTYDHLIWEDGAEIPSSTGWTSHGKVISKGSTGQWDARLDGMISPCCCVKKGTTYFLYYIGADGNRADGGPAHRKIGVATSTDGLNWTKYGSNPILTHEVGVPPNDESGIFSAGGFLDDADNKIVLYFGGMEENPATNVDSDCVLVTSSDGYSFSANADAFRHNDGDVWNSGDEIFPVGVWKHQDGTYHVYYIAKGGVGNWLLGLGTADDRAFTTNRNFQQVSNGGAQYITGCDVNVLHGDKLLVCHGKFEAVPHDLEFRTTDNDNPETLTTVADTQEHSDLLHATVFLDRATNTWFLFWVPDSTKDGIYLKTATAVP